MRRRDREITNLEDVEEIMKKAKVCRIGLVDNGEPYVVPLCFGYERGALYFHGAEQGRKIDIIKRNNRVCFETDVDVEPVIAGNPCDYTMKYRSVIGTGRAYILEDEEEKLHGLRLIMEKYTDDNFTRNKFRLDNVLVIKVDIDSIHGKQLGY